MTAVEIDRQLGAIPKGESREVCGRIVHRVPRIVTTPMGRAWDSGSMYHVEGVKTFPTRRQALEFFTGQKLMAKRKAVTEWQST